MRVTWNDHGTIGFGGVEQRLLSRARTRHDLIDCLAQPESQISSNLIVAAAARVQLAASLADLLDQTRFDKRMNVLGL